MSPRKATAEDRAKNPYLSADSIVYTEREE